MKKERPCVLVYNQSNESCNSSSQPSHVEKAFPRNILKSVCSFTFDGHCMWSEDMTNKIQTLYESLPRRMEAVIAAHGGNLSY
ncbi:hypothetical protein EON65_52640 [archaeon]|nr:MAG: hypothetical protein EON65_52640 [archaeon]